MAVCALIVFSCLVVAAPNPAASWCTQGYLAYAPTTGYAGNPVTFTFTFQNLVNATIQVSNFTVMYGWGAVSSFGAAVVGANGSLTRTSTETLPAAPGSSNLSATITGQASTDPAPIVCTFGPFPFTIAAPPAPLLSIAASPLQGDAPLNVSFTSTITGGTPPYTYAWSFGDGGTNSTANPSHLYTAAGPYVAILVATDGTGARRSASINITVNRALAVSVTPRPASGPIPLQTLFNASVSGGTPPYSFRWSFGDGNTSTQASANHTFERAGTFNVTLTVRDSAGASASSTVQVVVSPSGSGGGVPGLAPILESYPWVLPLTIAALGAGGAFAVSYRRSRRRRAPAPPRRPLG